MKSIGIKLADGSFYPIISDGETQKKTLDVTTVKDNQTTVQIDLYRSETDSMDDAEYVDSLEIKNLKPHPNGEPNLHLELSLDDENKLQAKVRDPETGKISSTKVNLISRSVEERNEPANFALGSTPEEKEAEKSLLSSSNDEDFSFDSLSEPKSDEDIPTEGFLSDSQVLSDNMISDSPLTDSDMLSPDDLFYDNQPQEDSNTIVDRDGTSFTFENETPESSASEGDDEMENLFEGINADNFVTIDGSEHTGENGFEVPEEFADLGSNDDFSIPSVDEDINDTSKEESTEATTEADSVATFDIPPLFDDSLFDETRAEGTVTSDEDFGTPSEPETSDLSDETISADLAAASSEAEDTSDDLDKVMENPFPDVDLSDIDDGTEIAAKEKETNYDLPSFDELGTDTTLSDDIVPDAVPSFTNDALNETEDFSDTTKASNDEAPEPEKFNLEMPDFPDTFDKDFPEMATKSAPEESVESSTVSEKTEATDTSSDLDLPDFNDLPDFDSEPSSTTFASSSDTSTQTTSDAPISDRWDDDDKATSIAASTSDSTSRAPFDLPDFDDFDSTKTTPDDLPDFGDPFSSLSSPTSHTDFELPDFDDSPAKKDLDQETSDFFENFDSNYSSEENSSFNDDFDDSFDSSDSSKYGYEEEESKKSKSKSHILLVAILACLLIALLAITVPTLLKNRNKTEIASNGDSSTENNVSETTIVESNASSESSSDSYQLSNEGTSSSKRSDPGIMGQSSNKKSSDKKSSKDKSAKKSKDKKADDKKTQEEVQAAKRPEDSMIAEAPKVERVTEPEAHTFAKNQAQKSSAQIAAKEDTIIVASTAEALVPVVPRRSDNSPADIKYKISRGDTLWDISKAYYKTPWNYERIAEYNGIKNPDFIRAGQEILLPVE